MNYTYKQIWLINFPVMMSILMEQLINITDAIFLGHVGEVELGASALSGIYYLAVYMLGFGFSVGDGSHSLPIAPFGFSLDPAPVDNFG